MVAERRSGLELLRIVAMSMIVALHFYTHGGLHDYSPLTYYLAPLVNDGVNLFILVSGYFLINSNWRTVARLALVLIIYHLINMGVCVACVPDYHLTWRWLATTLLWPLSEPTYWFVNVYFALVLLSPVLNRALRAFDTPGLRWTVAALTLFEVYSGFFGGNYVTGSFSLFHMIYIYILGYFLRVDPICQGISMRKGACVLAITWALYMGAIAIVGQDLCKYTNPLVIVSSAAIFIIFARWDLKSRGVNFVAAASLGVYLLQNGMVGDLIIYPGMREYLYANPLLNYALMCCVLFVAFWIGSILITSIINPILNRLFPKRSHT